MCHVTANSVPTSDRAQFDPGAHVSTSPVKSNLFGYQLFSPQHPCRVKLIPANGIPATPVGYGILRVPSDNKNGYLPVLCFHTPEVPHLLLSPESFMQLLPSASIKSSGYLADEQAQTFEFEVRHLYRASSNLRFRGVKRGGLLYTHPILIPQSCVDPALPPLDEQDLALHSLPSHHVVDEYRLHHLGVRAERLLWHQRLGHCSDNYLYHAHAHIDGVPEFKHHEGVLDQCPACIQGKMKKRAAGHVSTKKATRPWQGLSIDFAFTGQRSKNSDRTKFYQGLHGETCHVLIHDHFTGMLVGSSRLSKGAPLDWFRQ